MKYLLLRVGEEKYWYELDDEGYANRQIVLDEHSQIHISCLEDCLAEGPINEEDLDSSIINLSQKEFDALWKDTLKKYEKLWEEIKKRYPIRGNDFIAVYKGEEPFCLNQLVQYRVKSYDDVNMWLVVE